MDYSKSSTGSSLSAVDYVGAPGPDDARKPQKVSALKGQAWKYVIRRAIAKFSADACTDMAASLTYFGVMALFPALLALVSILGLVGQAEQTSAALLDLIGQLTDDSLVGTLREPVEQLASSRAAGWAFTLGLLTALWSASAYVGGFSRAMNRIYGTDEGRSIWKIRPTLLLVTLASVVLVAFIALLLVISGPIARVIGDAIGLGSEAVSVWEIAKWPVVGVLAIALIAMLYYFTPNVKQPKFRWISVGAGVALVSAVVASAGFGLYVANFSKYEKTYGTIAGVVVLLLWLWIVNITLLFGAELDGEIERGRELQAGIKAEEQLQLPPRDTRASLKKREKVNSMISEGRQLRKTLPLAVEHDGANNASKLRPLALIVGAGAVAAGVLTFRKSRRSRATQRATKTG
ncbi:YihY/virulence factor BrkB family protein [Arthrobacter alpinus]|uniref:YihY/virulence factor BrkB family protein n=1 Tax=Arthrobacter alpinus TaxID=656366 RepID=UPI0009FA21A1|nr:YihY/virulence factor BrkB family protein [Arthrobacter alpinus]